MADDKTKRGAADRRKVAGGEGYEVGYFARKHGLTRDAAQKLIDRVGNDREKLNAAATKQSS
jgi:ribosomal protein L35